MKTYKDRDGTIHTYIYDVLGRQTADAVTTLGSGVDGSVRRIETAYDTQGNAYLFTSFSDPNGGPANIVNQVQQSFDGQDNMTAEYQAHSGAVNTAKTPVVNYGYSDPSTGKSRLTSMTYPDSSVVGYNYNTGLDSSISRLSSISFNTGTAESYTYLGISTVVQRSNPMVTLSYLNSSKDITGLDSFGRVTDQKWTMGTSTVTDEFGYTYDADSNRTKETNALYADFNTTYTYDSFNQLSSSTRADGKDSESWSSDPLGNSTTVSGQSRGYNAQNEVTSVGGSSLAYDLNGNVITDEAGRKLTYDAWNRLVQVAATNSTCCCCNTTTVLAAYSYDALGRRIKETHGSTTTDLYYSNQWQVLEEVQGSTATADNVWSPVYVDALVLVKQIPSCGPTQLLYVQQDANWNVTAVVNSAGVQQRFVYTPFGVQTVLGANFSASFSSAMIAYGYQGGRYDSATGQCNFQRRDYSPTLQRWVEQDPLGYDAGDSDFYRYVGANPTDRTDASGLQPPPKQDAVPKPMRRDPDLTFEEYWRQWSDQADHVAVSRDIDQTIHNPRWKLQPQKWEVAHETLMMGCSGITLLNTGCKLGDPWPDMSHAFLVPNTEKDYDIGRVYNVLEKAKALQKEMQDKGWGKDEKNYWGEKPKVVIYSVRFWVVGAYGKYYIPTQSVVSAGSPLNILFLWADNSWAMPKADEKGMIDMDKWFNDTTVRMTRPPEEGRRSAGVFNFGFYDQAKGDVWYHSNLSLRAAAKEQSEMKVIESNLADFSDKSWSYSVQVICVAWNMGPK